jgi:CRISPR-associated protein (Cas_csx3)
MNTSITGEMTIAEGANELAIFTGNRAPNPVDLARLSFSLPDIEDPGVGLTIKGLAPAYVYAAIARYYVGKAPWIAVQDQTPLEVVVWSNAPEIRKGGPGEVCAATTVYEIAIGDAPTETGDDYIYEANLADDCPVPIAYCVPANLPSTTGYYPVPFTSDRDQGLVLKVTRNTPSWLVAMAACDLGDRFRWLAVEDPVKQAAIIVARKTPYVDIGAVLTHM